MAVTYSDLKIASITDGTEDGTWGTITNSNLTVALEEAIVGRANAAFPTDNNYTLPWTDTYASQVARNYALNVTGIISATRDLIVPSIEKPYLVQNNTTGGQSIQVKTAAGTGITIPNGKSALVYTDATNVVSAFTYVPDLTVGSITLSSVLPVASGGTGAATFTSAGILRGNGTSAISVASAADIVSAIGSTAVSVATNVAGGAANRIVYNTGAATTSYIVAPTVTDTFLKWDGSGFTWAAASGGGGGVSSVGVSGTNITVSGSPITSSGTISISIPQAVDTSSNVQFGGLGVGTSASAGEIRSTGNITAYYSDDRLKTRLGSITDALHKVMQLETFYYEANETAQALGYEKVREVGLSAQQVQSVLPEIVKPAPIDPQYLTIQYERLVPLLVQAIKELARQIPGGAGTNSEADPTKVL